MNIDALGAVAYLAGVDDARGPDSFDSKIEVCIAHHDSWSLTTQLKRDLGYVLRRCAHHGHATLHAAGQAHHADLRVASQRVAYHRTGPGDEIEYAFGQRRLGNKTGKLEGIVGGFAAGLDDDGVAGDQRGRHLAHDQEEGKVPGQDAGYDANGHLVEQDVFAGAIALDDLALVATSKLRHVLQVIG